MRHSVTLFIADRKQNEFMRMFDMKPDCKWFVAPVESSFTTTTLIDEAYFQRVIEGSKTAEETFWIPAIKYMNNLYVAAGVKILSDGLKEMFV